MTNREMHSPTPESNAQAFRFFEHFLGPVATPAGGKVRADEFKGKVLIARFWATW